MALPVRESGILSVAEIIARLLGLLFLSRLVTEIGLGESASFRIVLPLLGVAASFGSIGVPQALTRLFASGHGNWRVAGGATLASLTLSTAGLVGVALFALWQGERREDLLPLLTAALPLLLLNCLNGSLRGILFGLGSTYAPALAQLLEIGTRLWVLTAIWPLFHNTLPASGAQVGLYLLCTGELAACLFLSLVCFSFARQHASVATNHGVFTVLRMACAPAGQALLASLGYALELPLAQAWIAQHIGTNSAQQLIANYSAVALPLLTAPMVFTDSLATALLPAASDPASRSQAALQLRRVVGAVAMIAIPVSAALVVLAPLLTAWFGSASAARLLVQLAPLTLPLYLQAPLSSLLQAHGRSRALLIAGFLGDGVRLGTLYVAIHTLHLIDSALPLACTVAVCVQTAILLRLAKRITAAPLLPWRTLCQAVGASLPLAALLLVGLHAPPVLALPAHPFLWCLAALLAAFVHLRLAAELPPLPYLLGRLTKKEHL